MTNTQWINKYGQWAIITGASDGIGKEITIQLAEKGQNLVLVARRQGKLEQLSNELESQYGIKTRSISADLSSKSEIEYVYEQTTHLPLGLLVASAGFGTTGHFLDNDMTSEENMLDVNCRASMLMSHYYGARFAQQGHGGIILFGSLIGFQGAPNAAHYAATKAYIQSLAEGLHYELKPHGVDVLASAPGPVYTGFAQRANMQMNMGLTPDIVAKDTLNALGKGHTIRPGLLSKFIIFGLGTIPRSLRVRVMGQIMGGMVKSQSHFHQPSTVKSS